MLFFKTPIFLFSNYQSLWINNFAFCNKCACIIPFSYVLKYTALDFQIASMLHRPPKDRQSFYGTPVVIVTSVQNQWSGRFKFCQSRGKSNICVINTAYVILSFEEFWKNASVRLAFLHSIYGFLNVIQRFVFANVNFKWCKRMFSRSCFIQIINGKITPRSGYSMFAKQTEWQDYWPYMKWIVFNIHWCW